MARTPGMICPNCVFYFADDTTCRHSSPAPELSGNPKVIWPQVAATDWCGEGYNPTDGFYDQSATPPVR